MEKTGKRKEGKEAAEEDMGESYTLMHVCMFQLKINLLCIIHGNGHIIFYLLQFLCAFVFKDIGPGGG